MDHPEYTYTGRTFLILPKAFVKYSRTEGLILYWYIWYVLFGWSVMKKHKLSHGSISFFPQVP